MVAIKFSANNFENSFRWFFFYQFNRLFVNILMKCSQKTEKKKRNNNKSATQFNVDEPNDLLVIIFAWFGKKEIETNEKRLLPSRLSSKTKQKKKKNTYDFWKTDNLSC